MRATRLWLAIAMIVGLFAALVATGCGSSNTSTSGGTTASGSTDLQTLDPGKLLVGTDAPYPPFEIGTPEDSGFGGFDIDVMNAIAGDLGLDVTYQNTGFNTIFRDTASGLFDTAAAASTITAGRENTVDFTDPYYEANQALLVPTGSDIASTSDVTSDTIVGAQDGTTGETLANEQTDAGEVRGFPQGPDAIAALVTGQVDAVVIDQPVAADALKKQSGFEIAQVITTNELYGFAVSPQNDGLREAMNGVLAKMKQDGRLDDLYQKYFQTSPPQEVEGENKLLTND